MSQQTSIPLHVLPLGAGNSTIAMQERVISLTDAYVDAWENNNYQTVRNLASQFYGMGADILNKIELLTYVSSRERKLADYEDAQLSKTMKALAADNSPEAEEKKKAMLENFKSSLGEAEGQAAYDSMLDGTHPIFDLAITNSKVTDQETDFLGEVYVNMLTNAVSCDYIGYLRTGKELDSEQAIREEDTKLISELSGSLQDIHDAAYEALYNALKNDKPAEEMRALAKSYQEKLQGMFGISGAIMGPYLALISNGANGNASTSNYQEALKLSEIANRCTILYAYASYVRVALSDRSYNRWLSNEQRRTDKRAYSSGIPTGAKTSIQDLTSMGNNIADGTLVQVEGVVTSIEIKDDPAAPKFSTFVTLKDVQTNSTVLLRAHMFGLEDNGVAVGSYMRMNGFVRRNESWLAQDQTGLDFDRVPLNELAKTNWLDDVVERMRDYYPLYQDGMNTFFTLN
ncbi:MAG: hypothetical protein P8P74_02655 [Crocinitomicaceae bacterium]|nr:hypothetical protein [Crocinitomicaceae bacterium]